MTDVLTDSHRGVIWDERRNKWGARVRFGGKSIWVGYFADLAEATAAAATRRAELMASLGLPFEGCPAIYCGLLGTVVRVHIDGRGESRNVWWAEPGGPEHMFSLRRDNAWRMFPGPADGPVLEFLDR